MTQLNIVSHHISSQVEVTILHPQFFSSIGFILLALLAIVALSFFSLYHYQFFGPRFENARRQVFENTQSYVQGKREDLVRYRLQYETEKDSSAKEAIRRTILDDMANVDPSLLTPNQQDFLRSLH